MMTDPCATSRYVIAGLIVGMVFFLTGCAFLLIDLRKARQRRRTGQERPWYRRTFVLLGILCIVYTLGIMIPENILSLVLFHGSLIPMTTAFDRALIDNHLAFFNDLAFVSQGLWLAVVIWAILAPYVHKRKNKKTN